MTTHRKVVCSHNLTILVEDIHSRHLRAVLGVGDNLLCHTGCLVGLSTEGDVTLHIVELNPTSILADDNGIERVPLGDTVALLYNITILVVE